MWIKDQNIDNGKAFDFGLTSDVYAKYRDIYPKKFYEKIVARNLCVKGQKVLDVGTGTGVLPRNMYKYGAKWIGTDISKNQIEQARKLSEGMDIEYFTVPTEDISFREKSFDVITACQCFWYFKHDVVAHIFKKLLKADGRMLVLYMAWLPYDDYVAGESEKLVLKYNPNWSGAGETMHPIELPDIYTKYFKVDYREEFMLNVHFTRESWNGRMKSCRGIGASLTEDEIRIWEEEHLKMLSEIAPHEFDILHYGAILEMSVSNN